MSKILFYMMKMFASSRLAGLLKALAVVALALVPGVVPAAGVKGPAWLSDALFYQIYPSSYADSDGDGIGDLPGIISRLPYIKSLGVNAIWLNPVFVSGWFDGGYDVIDFYKVDPRFGTNTDLVTLVDEAHRQGIKVCLDLVAGHTSSLSPWFKESAQKDRNQRYSDYYIWTDDIPEADKEDIRLRQLDPNPASSTRGRYVDAGAPRARYYVKNFYECQPALNYGFAHPDPSHPWEQPVTAPGPQAVRRELRNVMAFWFDKGVDGFRVDMASSLVKNDPDKRAVQQLWQEMRAWKDRLYPDRVLISEWANPKMAIPAGFNIDFMIHFGVRGYQSLFFARDTPWGKSEKNTYQYCYFDKSGKGGLEEFVDNYTREYEATRQLGYIAIPTANHDFQRPNIGHRDTPDQLKVAMTFFLTMPGVPFIYYGDEIGMRYETGLPNKEGSNERAGSRTPMQWTDGPAAGFSSAPDDRLYLPVSTDQGRLTVQRQESDPGSLLQYTRSLVRLRHASAALDNDGQWRLLSSVRHPYPMVYERSAGGQRYIVVLNPSGQTQTARIDLGGQAVCRLASNKVSVRGGRVKAGAFSAAVFEMK